ncbi:D-amino-acid dehydrogenase [Novosphingobium fluoreni]|uniref:D-amino acid dehydrogenase n=1 Tax=Novosphingobium fluoreni TaxID=1391222 RepID=A0A7W6C1A1_9SPHN|nr:D-amino acid dehydrogenase [Novosphingobium fluoreni]MBB3938605.1 D-amino-acid dehydrogenase [Novosphingobium fluoreni]
MKIAVLGAGVIGVTSAWYLAKAGHEVEVIDRQPGPALETSFANAGQVSPGYSAPWAAPGIPLKAMKWLTMKHSPLVLRPGLDWQSWRWVSQMLLNCTETAYERNKGRMVRIAEYSRDRLEDLRAETGIAYDERTQGTLQLFRTQKQLDGIGKDIAVLRAYGVPYEVLDVEACVAAEPGLRQMRHTFVGGLRLPHDETGDCFKFTNALAQLATDNGVRFRFGTSVSALEHDGSRITSVRTASGVERFDAVLVACGSFSPALVRPLGITLPVYPVKGYSITVPIIDEGRAPVSTIMDETYKVAITRLGDRIRVGGTAEISGFNTRLDPARRETLETSVGSLFPGAADLAAGSFWTGMRPMTPDGTPVIGATPFANLFLNTGHGTLGWTMSCGSAQLIADIISGRSPAIDHADLGVARYA